MWYKLIYLKSGKKKDPLLTLSNYGLDITGADGSASFSVTYEGDGELTVSSSDENIAIASVLNNVVTVTYVSEGSVNIIVSLAESKKYLGDEKVCSITCIKSVPTLTLSSSTLSVDGATGSNTFTYTYDGDGDISVSSSNANVATVSANGNTITVTYVTAGSASITVTAAGTNRFSSNSAICTVTCSRTATTMTVSKTSMSIAGATGSGTFTYTCNGDGTISVTSSNTNVATVSRSGATITVTYKAAGSATITVSMANGTKYAATSKTCAVTCSRSNRSWSLSRTSASLTALSPSTTLTVTFSGDSQLNYASTNTGVANVSVNKRTTGATATITRSGNGSCKINFSVPQTAKYNAASGSVSVSCSNGTITFYVNNRIPSYASSRGVTSTFTCDYGTTFGGLGAAKYAASSAPRDGFVVRSGGAYINGTAVDSRGRVRFYCDSGGYYSIGQLSNGTAVTNTTTIANGTTYYCY